MRVLPALCHLREYLNLEVLSVLCTELVVLAAHAHLDVVASVQEPLEVHIARGAYELEVLRQPEADVLSEVVLHRPDEAGLGRVHLGQLVVVALGVFELALLGEVVGRERQQLALTERLPKGLHYQLHLLSAAVVEHHFELALGELGVQVRHSHLVRPATLQG